MPVSGKTYILIAIIMGITVFLIGMVWGKSIDSWAESKQRDAELRGYPTIKTIVFEPVEFVFDPQYRPFGAIVAGLLWPTVFLWILLVLIGLVIIPGAETINEVHVPLP